jgi:hypothetical protein
MSEQTMQRHAEEKFADWLPGLLVKEQLKGATVLSVLTVPMKDVVELFKKRFPEYSQATGLENKFPSLANGVPVWEAKWDHEKGKVELGKQLP